MKLARHPFLLSTSLTLLAFTLPVAAQKTTTDHAGQSTKTKTAADNSGQNAKPQTTADNQPNAQSDRVTAAKIRRVVVKDKELSTYAHNCKIVVKGGQVTLNGTVHSEEEKAKVAADAATVVDAGAVTNQLKVKQSK